MKHTTDTFEFAIPDDWVTFLENGKFVGHGPSGEELILSSWFAKAPKDTAERVFGGLIDQLVENAIAAAARIAADPELRVVQPLSPGAIAGGTLPCWTIMAESTGGEVFFGQAVIRGPRAVMLATLEAPNAQTREAQVREFLASVASTQISG